MRDSSRNSPWNPDRPGTRVKLCEFEYLEAAYEASFLGAEFLGFHIFSDQDVAEKSARFAAIFRELNPAVHKTLLTDLPMDQLRPLAAELGLEAIQYYDDCPPEDLDALREDLPELRILKVMSEKAEENDPSDDDAFLARYAPVADAFLLDSFRHGGTGVTGDWSHCAEIVRKSPVPVFLAGGLTPYNVRDAIEQVRPFGVDVESGVSDYLPDGRRLKNMLKCRLFIEKVREADWRLGRV